MSNTSFIPTPSSNLIGLSYKECAIKLVHENYGSMSAEFPTLETYYAQNRDVVLPYVEAHKWSEGKVKDLGNIVMIEGTVLQIHAKHAPYQGGK